MRLDKYLSHCNCGTRQAVKKIIKNKLVKVNGAIVIKAKFNIDIKNDEILVNNKKIIYQQNMTLVLHKPKGYLSATKDKNLPTVLDLVVEQNNSKNLRLIGRLDINTTGLLILTTNKTLIKKISHPKSHIGKKYLVQLKYPVENNYQMKFNEGIVIGDYKTLPAKYEHIDKYHCYLTIFEGKYHQIKRMFKRLGNEVINLHRIAIGNLLLDQNLKLGKYQKMDCDEVLEKITGESHEN